MRPLKAQEILDVWEAGQGGNATAAALTLLAAALPEAPREELRALPLGERDRQLLELRRRTLGPRLESVSRCRECGETVEMAMGVEELTLEPPPEPVRETSLELGELRVRLRLPTSEDLLAVEGCSSAEEARDVLLDRCVVEALRGGSGLAPAELSQEEIAAVEEALEAADPQAETALEIACPECGHRWLALLDPARFFTEELAVHARRLLGEVHVLARAYGWGEAEILALSAGRRRRYLEMLGG